MTSTAAPWLLLLLVATLPLRAASSPATSTPEETTVPVASPLTVEALVLEPATTEGAVYHLHAQIRNGGPRPASALRFQVAVAGRALPVYQHQVFMLPLVPDRVTTVPLFNLRAPEGGATIVEVTLVAARWLQLEERLQLEEQGLEIEGQEKGETQRLGASVPGLPVQGSAKLPGSP